MDGAVDHVDVVSSGAILIGLSTLIIQDRQCLALTQRQKLTLGGEVLARMHDLISSAGDLRAILNRRIEVIPAWYLA